MCSMTLHPREERSSPLDHTKWTQVLYLISHHIIMNNLPLGSINLNPVSNCSIILHPPEPLVLQVEAGGEYAGIQWTRTPIALNVSSDELVDFQQTFYRATTTVNDSGLYEADLVTRNATLAFASFKFNVTVYVGKCCYTMH